MTYIKRRKSFKYKQDRVVKLNKTSRTELNLITRAFVVGAVLASRDGYASANALAGLMQRNQSNLSALIRRVAQHAKDGNFDIWDPILYQNELGRGRKELLSPEQKKAIITIVTSSRENCEKEAWQAIRDGDFLAIIPKISISTFENVMYEAGYARRRPGWKPKLTPEEIKSRFEWAKAHNPDKDELYDNKGFNFRLVCYSDETPARIGEQRGMQRSWQQDGERYDEDVKKDRITGYTQLQFYGCFTYNYKGPCIIYERETELEKFFNDEILKAENEERREAVSQHQTRARTALNLLNESDVNGRFNTKKQQYTKKDDYTRGKKSRGGIDGFRHREETLKTIVPWLKALPTTPILLEDGAPAHRSRIATDYLTTERVDKLSWPGHSPEINASEHAWPWIRRHITKDFEISTTVEECKKQWRSEWEALPQEVINKWIDRIPEVVRQILRHRGNNDFHDGGG